MLTKVLIANRGEIACRIIRTCNRLGIRTVGIFTPQDRNSLHLTLADETYCIGPGAAGEGYLNADEIISIALKTNTEAIHPGYGFLAENHDFAQKCLDKGVVFIGPSPEVIRAMGLKNKAKNIMAKAGIPVIGGYNPQDQDLASLHTLAAKIGYPVMLKAIAGGGGRGMRVVHEENEMKVAMESAQRESLSSYRNEKLIIEKYIKSARHIEVQILGDNFGNVVHLFERECSLQRRHQKVIEEAPAPGLQQAVRDKLFEASIVGAKAIGYSGAGTFEYLVEPNGQFWFLEMNTRIQVEHPVTEFITGLDIVELQIRVSSGEKLPAELQAIASKGHAIEARIYSENADFTPSFGRIYHLGLPAESEYLRIDRGVGEGDQITLHYDPMIAKVIGHGSTRDQALKNIYQGLRSLRIAGPSTNEEFLAALVHNPMVKSGNFDTRFIESNLPSLLPDQGTPQILLAISAYALMVQPSYSKQGHSPWHDTSGWRLGSSGGREIKILVRNESWHFTLAGNSLTNQATNRTFAVEGEWSSPVNFLGVIDGDEYALEIHTGGEEVTVFWTGRKLRLQRQSELQTTVNTTRQSGAMISPMPGIIVKVLVGKGEQVSTGTSLLVLEAMKTEHVIRSPMDGMVGELYYSRGDQVAEGVVLLTIQ